MEQNILIFAAIGFLGLIIIIVGLKFSVKARKAVETIGAIIFHVGVFGILFYKVSLNLFISIVLLVLSLFILIDPLKIGNHLNIKLYRLAGYFILFSSVAFSLDYFSGFPVWLWMIPLIIYLSPYLFTSLRNRLKFVMGLAWMVVFLYVGLIGYVIYSKYNPAAKNEFALSILPELHLPNKDTPILNKKYLPKPDTDPSSKQSLGITTPQHSLPEPDTNPIPLVLATPPTPIPHISPEPTPYSNLNDLIKKYDELVKENQRLKIELEKAKTNAQPDSDHS